MKFRISVFIAVYRKEAGKIFYLVLKRKLHWKGWEFPKGGIELGESSVQAAKREVKEETSQIPLRIIKFKEKGKFNYEKIFSDRPGFSGQAWRLFSCEIANKKIRLDKLEHSGYKWLEFKKAAKILTWNNQKKCLKIVNNYIENGQKV